MSETKIKRRRLFVEVTHQTLILVALPLLFELIFVSVLFYLLHQAQVTSETEQHAKDVIYKANRVNTNIFDAGFAMGGYSMTKNRLFFNRFLKVAEAMPKDIDAIAESVKDDPKQAADALQLQQHWVVMSDVLKKAQDAIENNSNALDNFRLFGELKEASSQLKADANRIVEANTAITEASPRIKKETQLLLNVFIIAGVSGSILMTVGLALFFNNSIKTRLRTLKENTVRFADNQQLNAPMEGNDEIAELDTTFRTMATKLDEASQKEKEIVDYANDVICSIDENGTITRINPASQTLWNVEPELLLGKSCLMLLPENERQQMQERMMELRRKLGVAVVETAIETKNGAKAFASWSIRWSTRRNSFFCVIHDITARKAIENLKQEFMAMVSHDLRSPLSSLRGTLSMLKMGAFGELPPAAVERVVRAENSTAWLINMLNDLLDIEKLESGMVNLSKDQQDLKVLIDESIEPVKALAEAKQLPLVVGPIECGTAMCDADRLKQVLMNLISNAIKYSETGSTIYIGVFRAGNEVEFRVKDHGRGIPADKLEAIFERYQQVTSSDAKNRQGFGLGLPICKMIIESHEGTIGVISAPAKGSTFWFRIPSR